MNGTWLDYREESLAGLSAGRRAWFHASRWLLVLLVAVAARLAFPTTASLDVPVYAQGTMAEREVVAPVTFAVPDSAGQATADEPPHLVRAGDRIVSAGEVVSEETHNELAALRHELLRRGPDRRLLRTFVGPVLFNALVVGTFWLMLLLYRWETYREYRELVFLTGCFIAVVLVASAVSRIFPDRPELVPVPFAAILITILYNGRLAVVAAMMLAILLGSQWALESTHLLFIALVSGVAAAIGTRAVRRRKHLYRSIGTITAAYAIAAATLGLLYGWSPYEIMASVVAGAVTALGSASVAMLLLPVAEAVTRITTDITLLELSDPTRPLLRRLATEAPGTYAHSIGMANLCEAGCAAIGANGLLARVGCYYHDIGKVMRPQYFTENQVSGYNPHDRLSADRSARIIRDHVIDGLELAREAGLPEAVRAFIAEHHGTMYMDYFRDRARREGSASESENFRYPGPTPHTVETAVAMLADSSEAALRVLGAPSPERIRSAIEFLFNQKIEAGQLREAPLTLRDLDRVKEEFIRVLSSVYHTRVEYPGSSGGIAALFPRAGAG